MTIETTRAPEGVQKDATQASRTTASPARSGAAGAPKDSAAGGGFAGLMSLLSATDTQAEPINVSLVSGDAALVVVAVSENEEKNMPLALDAQGLIAPHLTQTSESVVPAKTAGRAGSTNAASANAVSANAASANAAAANAATANAALATKLAATSRAAINAKAVLADAVAQQVADADVAALLDHRRVSQLSAAVQAQMDVRQASVQPGLQPAMAAAQASHAGPTLVSADGFAGAPNRRDGGPVTGQVRTGLEGAMGSTVADRLGISATYEVAQASAVVAEGQVAETVSYWASKGVQSAQLTLDGLGDEPVQVRISVDGDQTQIDFISDQPEVRQLLESATEQLKAMLSGQGLQLTGMSVGTSGQGGAQDHGRQPPPGARQAKLQALEPAPVSGARVANAAVGQALDLYV